ncbi:hypothetical protein WR25_16192 [Diploscapter pachys]|uniref:RNA helicase n=1 Tax=Diploscapter pachys TaxID=2018661 RepID=A0A2A2L979_9BILA|nr:hypothetical protein WR25_16192 [Diploscapter pachys]
MNYMDIVKLRNSLNVRVGGLLPPNPVCSFAHFGFDEYLMEAIRRSEYEKPTPIQAQAVPAALSGRDVLGIAKTGSGKTAAYLWPAIEGEGPIALIVVPTRELAIQVYQEAKRFCRVYNINVICAYGGGSKYEQSNELQNEGAELVVCTPGRIIDLVKIEATNFLRTTFLVFDEADRMFDMGFEAQVKSISDHVRSDRQCLMFSATFKQKVERLARDALVDPVRIVQGEVGEANADVKQHACVLPSQEAKLAWLCQRLVDFASLGKVLIFVNKKLDSEDLAHRLSTRDFKLVLLHGDMLQAERNEMLLSFRKKMSIMIATDVAARGLDIPEIRTVINYDMARDIDTHVHRIGRTGRAGQIGNAYTLVTEKDFEMAGHLVKNLESVNQEVPKELMSLAMKSSWFSSERRNSMQSTASSSNHNRFGLGFKPKVKGPAGGSQFDPLKDQRKSTVSKTPSLEKTITAATSEGPTNRTDVMKKAFKQSFSHSFHASTMESSNLPQQTISDPRPEWKRKIDEINAKLTAERAEKASSSSAAAADSESAYQSTSRNSDSQRKKRSRWE